MLEILHENCYRESLESEEGIKGHQDYLRIHSANVHHTTANRKFLLQFISNISSFQKKSRFSSFPSIYSFNTKIVVGNDMHNVYFDVHLANDQRCIYCKSRREHDDMHNAHISKAEVKI
jgi:hypothetical protein